MANDYSIIGSVSGYSNRFMPLERVPLFDQESSVRVREVSDLKHKDETDLEFMESLYRNSNPDYYLGAWVVKAVVDILLEFTIGDLPTIQATDKNYEKFCNKLWTENQSQIYAMIKELGLYGQEFMYVGWDRIRQIPKFRPMSKANIIDIRYEDFNDPDEITYVRIREQFTEAEVTGVDEYGDNQVKFNEVYYDKIFWKELNPKFKEDEVDALKKKNKKDIPQWLYKMKILKRIGTGKWEDFRKETINPLGLIPIIEFNQNKLSSDKIGHSDLSGALKIVSVYHQVLESTINNNLYNGQPTLKFTGLDSDPLDFVKRMYGDMDLESNDIVTKEGLYSTFGSYYLPNDADVNWLVTPSTTGASKEILNLLFYILVQITGVPEWALGAGMEGAWATVKQQSLPLLQKVRAKRMDINDDLLRLNRLAYMVNKFYVTDTIEVSDFGSKIVWGDVLSNDTATQIQLVEFMLQNHFITEETAVSLLGLVNDPLDELGKAKKQFEKKLKDETVDDNTDTMQKLMQQKVSKGLQGSEKPMTDDGMEEVDGEMVSAVFNRIIGMLFEGSNSASA